jgi:hypothetical protein
MTVLAKKQTVVMNAGMTVLATKQIVPMNVASFSSGIRVSGCHVNDDSIGNEADNGNECCLPWFCYEGPWLPGR